MQHYRITLILTLTTLSTCYGMNVQVEHKRTADMQQVTAQTSSPLVQAVEERDLKRLQELIRNGTPFNSQEIYDHEYCPIIWRAIHEATDALEDKRAAEYSKEEAERSHATKQLWQCLYKGQNPTYGNKIEYDATTSHHKLIKHDFFKHADLNKKNRYGQNALTLAAIYDHATIIEDGTSELMCALLRRGAQVDEQEIRKLPYGAEALEIINDWLYPKSSTNSTTDAKENAPKKDARPALVIAAEKEMVDVAKKLIESGEPVNIIVDQLVHQPLFAAAYYGKLEMVKYLIQAGAHVDAKSKAPWAADKTVTALVVSGRYDGGYSGILRALIHAGATVDADEINQLPNKEAVWITIKDALDEIQPVIDEQTEPFFTQRGIRALITGYAIPATRIFTPVELREAVQHAADALRFNAMRKLILSGAPVPENLGAKAKENIAEMYQEMRTAVVKVLKGEPQFELIVVADAAESDKESA